MEINYIPTKLAKTMQIKYVDFDFVVGLKAISSMCIVYIVNDIDSFLIS
jgi:hypothetical protein